MGKKRIENVFKTNKNRLSIYITAGYPTIDAMPKIIEVLDNKNIDFIEAGMPYSDPLADGETIQKSSSIALKNGMNLNLYFSQIKKIRSKSEIPILFMGYFNQLLKRGIDKFLQDCVEAGIDGLIIPDLSPEIYQQKYKHVFDKYDLAFSFLITPTTSNQRIKLIDSLSSGFIYAVSSSATTGKTNDFGEEQIKYFERLHSLKTNNSIVIGFGIDNREKYVVANDYTSGAIIGSAFIKAIYSKDEYLKKASEFVEKIIKNNK